MKVELDISNYATGVATTNLEPKSDLAGLKLEVDKIDTDKLKAADFKQAT